MECLVWLQHPGDEGTLRKMPTYFVSMPRITTLRCTCDGSDEHTILEGSYQGRTVTAWAERCPKPQGHAWRQSALAVIVEEGTVEDVEGLDCGWHSFEGAPSPWELTYDEEVKGRAIRFGRRTRLLPAEPRTTRRKARIAGPRRDDGASSRGTACRRA